MLGSVIFTLLKITGESAGERLLKIGQDWQNYGHEVGVVFSFLANLRSFFILLLLS